MHIVQALHEGVPVHGRPFEKGNLYVHFKVCGLAEPDQLCAQKKGYKKKGKKITTLKPPI